MNAPKNTWSAIEIANAQRMNERVLAAGVGGVAGVFAAAGGLDAI